MEADARAARSHGLAAVRAVRDYPKGHGLLAPSPATLISWDATIRTSARLAFRAALSAVGLKTL